MAQADGVVANGTGSAVRADINGQLAALFTNHSGSTEPATTFAFQTWADTNTNTLKLRNSANDGWIQLARLDGQFDAKTFHGNVTLNAQSDLRLADSDSSNWVAFQAPATVASNVTWTLPAADGTSGQTLQTNGSGTLSWSTPSASTDIITEGNTSAEVVDTGSDGHFKVVTEGAEALRVDASQRVGIGTTNPSFRLHSYDNSGAQGFFNGWSAYSTYNSSGAIRLGDQTSYQGRIDYDGGTTNFIFENSYSSGLISWKINGTEQMKLSPNGDITLGNSANYFHKITGGGGNNSLHFIANAGQQNAGSVGLTRFSTSAYGAAITERVRITESGVVFTRGDSTACQVVTAAGANTSNILCQMGHSSTGITSGTISFKITSNGNVTNTNNSYGSLSDIKLKENIVDANSQWEDLKAIQVRNYNFKEETGQQTHTQLGVVAQEVELISPGLVYESPDRETVQVPVLDENGEAVLDDNGDPVFTTEERETGEVTKSVNYSVLYMKAIKALQEAMERIETLETKVAALEGGT